MSGYLDLNILAAVLFIVNSAVHYVATMRVFDKPVGVDWKLKLTMVFFTVSSVFLVVMIFLSSTTTVVTSLLGLLLMSASLLLFLATCKVHQDIKLTPIHSTNSPSHLVVNGPYGVIRHPFYTAYLLNYTGAALASVTPLSLLVLVGLVLVYRYAATQEEKKFNKSDFGECYHQYQRTTGLFLPRFF